MDDNQIGLEKSNTRPIFDAEWAGGAVDLRVVLDALPRAVVVSDADGRILMWNAAAVRLYGWSEHEVLGRSVLDVFTPVDHLEEQAAILERVSAGNTSTGDRVVLRRDGDPVRIVTHAHPVFDADGRVTLIVGASEDVTDLWVAEQQAADLTEHLRVALDAGGLGTWRWDMNTGITMWDATMEALFGLPPGGFDGTFDMYASRIHPDDLVLVLDTVNTAVDAKSAYRLDHRVVWPDGTVRWLSCAGRVTVSGGAATGTIGCSLDVTERVERELERELAATRAAEAAEREALQRQRLEFIGVINDALNGAADVRDIMSNVTKAVVPQLGDWCSIHVLPNRDSVVPDVEIAHVDPAMVAYAIGLQERFPYDPNGAAGVPHVIRTGETQFFPDITDDVITALEVTDEARGIINQLALRSSIAVPLVKHGRVLGAMQFVMSTSSRRYTEDDVTVAQAIAARIASSIENRRLNEHQRHIARTLQQSLLPDELPDIPGVEIAVRYWAAGEGTEVGGDFYDVFATGPLGHWSLVIGDVCGTGPAAAASTGLARHTIRAAAWHGDDHTGVLTALNRAVLQSASNSFCTAVYATIEVADGNPHLVLACGGHPLPVLITNNAAVTIGAPGTLVGVFDTVEIHPRSVTLAPGDVVVFYTDGATDVAPPYLLNETDFANLAQDAATGAHTAEEVADRVHAALETVLPFDDRNDDIALLVLRVADP